MWIIETVLVVLKAMWVSISFILTAVGIFFFWSNIQELPKIYPRLFGWIPALEQEEVLWIALVAALTWILWMDVRPFALGLIQRQSVHPLQITPFGGHTTKNIIYSSHDDPSITVTKIIHLIGVQNEDPENKTIRNVQVQVGFMGRPIQLVVEQDGAPTADIQHGTTVYFKVGYSLWADKLVSLDGYEKVSAEEFLEMQQIARHPRVFVEGLHKEDTFALQSEEDPWLLNILISADSLPLKITRINVWPDKAEKALSFAQPMAPQAQPLNHRSAK